MKTGNIENVEINCPYCGELIEIVIDCSAGNQNYIEDCEVCCRPITLDIKVDQDGNPNVDVSREDEL